MLIVAYSVPLALCGAIVLLSLRHTMMQAFWLLVLLSTIAMHFLRPSRCYGVASSGASGRLDERDSASRNSREDAYKVYR